MDAASLSPKIHDVDDEKRGAFISAVGVFATELEKLGFYFAGVVLDPEQQTDHSTRLKFAGNVTMDAGRKLMKKFAEFNESDIVSGQHVKSDDSLN